MQRFENVVEKVHRGEASKGVHHGSIKDQVVETALSAHAVTVWGRSL